MPVPVRPDHHCSERCLLLCSFLLPHFILLSKSDSGDFCSRFILIWVGGGDQARLSQFDQSSRLGGILNWSPEIQTKMLVC